ncbi:Potassium channel SKOR [Vitis vinifera]|uniref:Potassium channel n=1 Tax=Vitis vinifera TaxID=29760 RepID=A0A438CWF7_VITVI|nr:Potassium channel SKOR [Vitis vinifera]
MATRVHEEIFLPGEVILEEEIWWINFILSVMVNCYKGADVFESFTNVKDEKRVGSNEDEIEGPLMHLQTNDSFGEIPLLCNTPLAYTVQVVELCRLVRLDKQSFINILEIYFSDGQIILNNLLEGKGSNLRNKILESDITLYIGKHEAEVAMRVNCAAYNGDLYQLRRLIEAGADPNKTDYDGRSPLHFAASKGYEDITDFLIELRVNIHLSDNHGNTPLLEAIKNGHDGVTSLLVKAGALLTVEDAGGCLCMTVVRRDLNFLKRLLANGINPNAKNYDSRTPLHLAASEGLYSMTNLLLEAGASVLAKDRIKGRTLLEFLDSKEKLRSPEPGGFNYIPQELDHHSIPRWGNTPLDEARIGGNKNLIKLLEEAMSAQLSEFSSCSQEIRADKMRQRKCTVFPFHPWDSKEERKQGVVLWIPKTIEELIETAMDQLKCSSGSCILSENGAKITNIDMISDEEKLFLVAETI